MTESKIYFKFDGKKYAGNEGDTIAAALLRNNVRLIGRSFKYHRPRGIYTCGIEAVSYTHLTLPTKQMV